MFRPAFGAPSGYPLVPLPQQPEIAKPRMPNQESRSNAAYCLLLSEFLTVPSVKTMLLETFSLYAAAAQAVNTTEFQSNAVSIGDRCPDRHPVGDDSDQLP